MNRGMRTMEARDDRYQIDAAPVMQGKYRKMRAIVVKLTRGYVSNDGSVHS